MATTLIITLFWLAMGCVACTWTFTVGYSYGKRKALRQSADQTQELEQAALVATTATNKWRRKAVALGDVVQQLELASCDYHQQVSGIFQASRKDDQ